MRSWSLVVATLLALACGAGDTEVAEQTEVLPIAGMYEVTGVTVALESGHRREIAGTVILAENGDQYTATFHLNTTYPGARRRSSRAGGCRSTGCPDSTRAGC